VIALEELLRRERAIVAAGLAALCLLAWAYIWRGAGMGMSTAGMAMPHPGWALVVAMWWLMMIAMMLPSAAPFILLHARVLRRAQGGALAGSAYAPSAFLLAGYLAVWLGFSLAATAIQQWLGETGLLSPATLGSNSAGLSAAVLAAAGVYQLSPLKRACLHHCRSPVDFLTRHWRPGWSGAVRLGLWHGAYCVGCCWILMGLLFVGGVMNVAWIAALTLFVLAEKLAPGGEAIGKITGVLLLAWAGASLAV